MRRRNQSLRMTVIKAILVLFSAFLSSESEAFSTSSRHLIRPAVQSRIPTRLSVPAKSFRHTVYRAKESDHLEEVPVRISFGALKPHFLFHWVIGHGTHDLVSFTYSRRTSRNEIGYNVEQSLVSNLRSRHNSGCNASKGSNRKRVGVCWQPLPCH
jgi:hypothetical protein